MRAPQEANKELVRRVFAELWNEGRYGVAGELFAPGYRGHDPADALWGTGQGPEAVARFVATVRSASGDVRFSVEDLIAEGDLVMARWRAEGTHTGEILGIPATGGRVDFSGVVLYRVEAGRITEGWHGYDSLELLRQLGADPSR